MLVEAKTPVPTEEDNHTIVVNSEIAEPTVSPTSVTTTTTTTDDDDRDSIVPTEPPLLSVSFDDDDEEQTALWPNEDFHPVSVDDEYLPLDDDVVAFLTDGIDDDQQGTILDDIYDDNVFLAGEGEADLSEYDPGLDVLDGKDLRGNLEELDVAGLDATNDFFVTGADIDDDAEQKEKDALVPFAVDGTFEGSGYSDDIINSQVSGITERASKLLADIDLQQIEQDLENLNLLGDLDIDGEIGPDADADIEAFIQHVYDDGKEGENCLCCFPTEDQAPPIRDPIAQRNLFEPNQKPAPPRRSRNPLGPEELLSLSNLTLRDIPEDKEASEIQPASNQPEVDTTPESKEETPTNTDSGDMADDDEPHASMRVGAIMASMPFTAAFEQDTQSRGIRDTLNERSFIGHKETIYGCHLSKCGRYMATVGVDSTIRVWNVKKNKLISTLTDHDPKFEVLRVAW